MMMNPIHRVGVLVAAGSVDGMTATAAYIRHAADPNIRVVFTQAFLVDKVAVSSWPSNSKVGFIDLGVNNQGSPPNPQQLTVDFVNKIYQSGHTIVFIADEHDKKAWDDVLEKCDHSTDELSIKPVDRGGSFKSSCAILKEAFGNSIDDHAKELLEAGDQADQMNFNTRFGKIFNNSIKSDISNNERRLHVVKHLTNHDVPDETIQGWMNEYAEIESNQLKILQTRVDLKDDISLFDCTIGRHDATSICNEAYDISSIVVLRGTNVWIEGKMQRGVSIATNRKDLNILGVIKQAGIQAGGMAAKANLADGDLTAAIEAVRAAL
jgi:hypothetical protein